MRFAVAALWFATLSLAAPLSRAQTDDACVELMRRAEASASRFELTVSGESQGYDRVAFRPDPASDVEQTGRYLQLNRFIADTETYWDGLDTFVCDANRLLLYEFRPEVGSPGVEQFDPPLPWLVLPLEAGLSWDWEGRVTVPGEAGPAPVEGRIAFRVRAQESLQTPAGAFDAWPVELEVFLAEEATSIIRTVTWLVTAPGFGLVRRERYEPGASTTPLWTWELARVTAIDAETGAEAPPSDETRPSD